MVNNLSMSFPGNSWHWNQRLRMWLLPSRLGSLWRVICNSQGTSSIRFRKKAEMGLSTSERKLNQSWGHTVLTWVWFKVTLWISLALTSSAQGARAQFRRAKISSCITATWNLLLCHFWDSRILIKFLMSNSSQGWHTQKAVACDTHRRLFSILYIWDQSKTIHSSGSTFLLRHVHL